MKIAYLMNSPIPSKRANSVHVMKMCQAFKENGSDITLFCEKGEENNTCDEIYSKYNITGRFPICKIDINKYFRNTKLRVIFSALKMVKKVEEDRFDFLYGRSLFGLYLLRNKYKFIYESHIPPVNPLFKFIERKLIRSKNCVKLVVISQALKQEYLRLFNWISEDKIVVLHDGADIQEETEFESVNLDNSKSSNPNVKIGYLGHLYPGKCMEILIKVAIRRPNYYFHIVGGTDDWVTYWNEKLIQQRVTNIKLYGYVDNCEIGKYYSEFDICILPFSKDVFYTKKRKRNIGAWISPLKLFEAMSFGKAILVSELPTIKEVLDDNVNALFANPDDIDEWAYKLDMLVENKELRDKLGSNAKEKLASEYTWFKRAKYIINMKVEDNVQNW